MIRQFSYLYIWNPCTGMMASLFWETMPHQQSQSTLMGITSCCVFWIKVLLLSHINVLPMSSSNFCLWRLEAKVSRNTCFQYPIWMVSMETLHAVSRLFFWQHQSVLTADTSTGTMQVRNRCVISALKTKDLQSDNVVVTGNTAIRHYDNLRCHQWGQNHQIYDLLFWRAYGTHMMGTVSI